MIFRKRICTFYCFAFMLSAFSVSAQHEQLWLEHQLSYPFKNVYLLENTTSYQTVLTNQNKWRSISIGPTFEYALFTRLELTSELPIGYTLQKEGSNTFEISPLVGARFHITQGKRIDTRLAWRYQVRAFREIEAAVWDISNRTRLRGEIFISLNGPNLFTDKLWYLFMDYEEFFVIDDQVQERFANRRRARIGLGYRASYKHRFDLGYTLQSSRNQIDGDYISNDNVIQFKYKMFLNPAKPISTNP